MARRRAHTRHDPRTGKTVQVQEHDVRGAYKVQVPDFSLMARVKAAAAETGPRSPEGVPYAEQHPVLVYGTLRPGEGNYGWSLAGNTVEEVEGVRLEGTTMWTNGGFPYVAERDDGQGIVGTLMYVDESRWSRVREDLDTLEGFNPGSDSNHYVRSYRTVTMPDGSTTEAWVYLADPSIAKDLDSRYDRVRSGDWMDASRRRRNVLADADTFESDDFAGFDDDNGWLDDLTDDSECADCGHAYGHHGEDGMLVTSDSFCSGFLPSGESVSGWNDSAVCVDCDTPGSWLCPACEARYSEATPEPF
jgi:gamma-glutamylcyclotransferase (GGCT)/AIG2-like uncharacterized protein YtfP